MEAQVARLAENDPLNPPKFLKGSRQNGSQADAMAIFRELAPLLQRRNLLDRMDRYAFARWCVYQAEWIRATQEIARDGITRMVKTVSGDEMPRRHPAASHRDRVELSMGKLEASYGLTPGDRYKLMRDQAAAPLGGLFDREGTERPSTSGVPVPATADAVGFLADRATPPPGTRLS